MSLCKLLFSTVFGISLLSSLAGCSTYGKCDSGSCAGDDAAITTNVRSLLDEHAELGAPHSINVQTIHRVVYLNGQVNDGLARGIAESLALQTTDVRKVVNSIVVEK
jgi:osmotically-inducible protein OsmY